MERNLEAIGEARIHPRASEMSETECANWLGRLPALVCIGVDGQGVVLALDTHPDGKFAEAAEWDWTARGGLPNA